LGIRDKYGDLKVDDRGGAVIRDCDYRACHAVVVRVADEIDDT
jgi:hypothetical protein